MGGFSLNSRSLAIVGLIIATALFAFSRMPGGIGGTGITGAPGGIGGTGIYGRIDGFGSIWVNGVEIFYDEDQNVVRQGRDGLPEELKIGQIVAVIIDEETGRAEAQSIEIIEEVNGPIDNIADDHVTILGQKVILTDDTIIEGTLESGQQMAVNGFRAPDGSIIASRIDKPLVEGEVSLRGPVNRLENGRFWINGQELEIQGEQVDVGNTIEIRGRLGAERRRFIINNIKKRRLPFDRRPARISYQGMFNNVKAIDLDRPMLDEIETAVIEFKPNIDQDILVIPRSTDQMRTNFKNNFKRERIANRILERRNQSQIDARRQVDIEARRQAEVEARRQGELEARRPAEVEARRQGELEARRQGELEARRQGEIEARRQGELEARRQGEIEARRQVQIEARRQGEIEARRQAELEARRQSEIEARQQREAAIQRLPDFEARRQTQLEALNQAQTEARSEAQQETLRQLEGEIRRKTEEELKEEIRSQVRAQSREEIRQTIRQEVQRRARRQLRRGGIQP